MFLRAVFVTVAIISCTTSPKAQTSWTGDLSEDWLDAGNWSAGAPVAGSQTSIDTTSPNETRIDGVAESGNLRIGVNADGRLTIWNGGSLASGNTILADSSDSQGEVFVLGPGTTWTNSSYLVVGDSGTAILFIGNGASVANTTADLAESAGAVGTVTVSGAGSTWDSSGRVTIGARGEGLLEILDGGHVSNTSAHIGDHVGSEGTVLVSGTDSRWTNSSYLSIGERSIGNLRIEDGGRVTNTAGYVGYEASATGNVTVTGAGSLWANSSGLYLGEHGSAFLTIENGGAASSSFVYVGGLAGSDAEVLVTDNGSTWTPGSLVVVGEIGRGRVFVRDGASVSNSSDLRIGEKPGGDGGVEITGENSQWNVADAVQVGDEGSGFLTIADGGNLTSDTGVVGRQAGGEGAVELRGTNSGWTIAGDLSVGDAGTGELLVADGAKLASASGSIGRAAGAEGAVTLTGTNASWEVGADLVVADVGSGSIRVADGAALIVQGTLQVASAGDASGSVTIGGDADALPEAPGDVTVSEIAIGDGAGKLVFNHTSDVYSFDPAISGTGTITILNGTTRLTADSTLFTGTTDVEGGALLVSGGLGGIVNVHSDGVLGGSGTVGATTVFDGGVVSPGNSIGTLTINGDLIFNVGSIYRVEVNADGSSDLVNVNGDVFINGGIVQIHPSGTNFPEISTYRIVNATGGINGTFNSATNQLAFFDNELVYDADYIDLVLKRNDLSFDDIVDEPDEKEIAEAIEDLGGSDDLYGSFLTSNIDDARKAVVALRGGIHTSVRPYIHNQISVFNQIVSDQEATAFNYDFGAYTSYARLGEAPVGLDRRVWGQVFHRQGRSSIDRDSITNERTSGFMTGINFDLAPEIRAGLSVGFGRSFLRNALSDADARIDHFVAAGSVSRQFGASRARFGGMLGVHQVATSRSIAFNNFSDIAKAGYHAFSGQAFSELSHTFRMDRYAISPFASFAATFLYIPGFAERGGATALATAASKDYEAIATAGLRAMADFGDFTLSGTFAAQTNIGAKRPSVKRRFLSGTRQFSTPSATFDEIALLFSASIDYATSENSQINLRYDGKRADDHSSNGLRVTFSSRF